MFEKLSGSAGSGDGLAWSGDEINGRGVTHYLLGVQMDVVLFKLMMSSARPYEFSICLQRSEVSVMTSRPPLTHQRDGARRRHLVELLLVERKGMSEFSHGAQDA